MAPSQPKHPDLPVEAAWRILEELPLRVWLKDTNHRFIYLNQIAAEALKISSPADAYGKTDGDFFHSTFAGKTRADEIRLLRGETAIIDQEELNLRSNHTSEWVHACKILLKDPSGSPIAVVGMVRGIAETKATLDRYRNAMEATQEGVWYRVYETHEVWFSPRWKAILGYKEEEIKDRPDEFWSRVHHEDRPKVKQARDSHLQGNSQEYFCEFRMKHKDESWRWIRSRGRNLPSPHAGRESVFAGSHADITHTRNRDYYLQLIPDVSPALVWVKNANLDFAFANLSLATSLGTTPDAIVGMNDYDFMDKKQADGFRKDDQEVLETGEPKTIREEPLTINGQTRILATRKGSIPSPDGDSRNVLGVAIDMTELAEARQKLIEVEKGHILVYQDLAHQLRGPATHAYARIETILDRKQPPDTKQLVKIKGILGKAKRVTASIGLLAEVGRGSRLQKRMIWRLEKEAFIKFLIEAASDNEVMVDDRGVRFNVERESFEILDQLSISGNMALLQQCVNNVLDNAGKYSSKGTHVTISGGRSKKGDFALTVRNVGIGFKPGDSARALERGWRGQKAGWVTGEGSGIGLWLSNLIMRSHGGRVNISQGVYVPKRGRVTDVKLIFPAQEEGDADLGG